MSGMTLWILDVEKRIGEEYWTNVYHINASTLTAARTIADDIITRERARHRNVVNYTYARLRPKLLSSGGGTKWATGGTGDINAAGVSYMPLFNCIRVDFLTATGRPSRKYYRTPVYDANQTNGLLTAATRTDWATWAAGLAAVAGFVDPQGQTFVSAYVAPEVGMRQLRRGSKRKQGAPVIP